MTYHIISILNEGAYLSVDLGFLVCRYKDGRENRIALDDVRGVVVAHPATSFSSAALARLLERDAVVLHCNRHYKPVGWSVPLDRVIRGTVFQNQLAATPRFNEDVWRELCLGKMQNQATLLTQLGVEHDLNRLINRALPNEANVARAYWRPFLSHIGAEFGRRERQGASSFENKALNYGYAVMATLVHRAVLLHGLLPSLGVHHKFRYRSAPLVYDVLEPCRGLIDLLLAKWRLAPEQQEVDWPELDENETEVLFKEWVQYLMLGLRNYRLKPTQGAGKHTLKWLDAPDKLARSVAAVFEQQNPQALWLPSLAQTYYHAPSLGSAEDEEPYTEG